MQNLTRASQELFRRSPDETFPSLAALSAHCRQEREESTEYWRQPEGLWARAVGTEHLMLSHGEGEVCQMTDWSFGQLCRLGGVAKDTVNRLSPDTASRVLAETLPHGNKPLQVYTVGQQARSIHGASYTRLYNAELLDLVDQCADGFEPPPEGLSGATGLYCGEQDMFLFLIDPAGWVEIGGEAFAPGLFLWNSEVGRRSLGVETFWFQAVCQNHIVWDAVEIAQYKRKHTANVRNALGDVRGIIQALVAKRDQRRDGFARAVKQAMQARLGDDADEALKSLSGSGIARSVAKRAIEMAHKQGALTVFAVVDALTRLSRRIEYAGDRTELDRQAGKLLTLAA
jgi:histone H3/H4